MGTRHLLPIVLAVLAPLALAQVSQEDAAARLKAREAERQAAASTQPASLAEVDALTRQVKALTARLQESQAKADALSKENRELKAKLDKANAELAKVSPPAPAGSSFSVGMSRMDAEAMAKKLNMEYDVASTESLVSGQKVVREEWTMRYYYPGVAYKLLFENDTLIHIEKH